MRDQGKPTAGDQIAATARRTPWRRIAACLLGSFMVAAVLAGVTYHSVLSRGPDQPGIPGAAGRVALVGRRATSDDRPVQATVGRMAAGPARMVPSVPSKLDPPKAAIWVPSGIDRKGSSALSDVPAGWISSYQAMTVGNLPRSYLMIRPPPLRAAASLPVVVVLHGRGLTPTTMEHLSHLLPVVGRAIVVYPAGWGRSWNAGGCCGAAHRADVNDVAFLTAVVHRVLSSQADASARHVYLVGFSNGGRMAMHLACADSGMFAGLAAVEAVPVAACRGIHPLPTVLIASSADPLLSIPLNGPKKTMQGYLEPTVGQTVDQWRQLDGCGPGVTSTTTGVVTSTVWDHCRGRGRVQYDLYRGGAHRWPPGSATTPSASTLISRFLFDAQPGVTAA